MTVHAWISIVACAGHLALAILVLIHRTRSPLRLPLALLALELFAWNFAELAYSASGNIAWHWIDRALSPLSAPLAIHFVAIFVGRARGLRYVLALSYAAFASLGFWIDSASWEQLFLAEVVASMALALGLLVAHLRQATDGEERVRTRLVLAALAIGAVLGSVDLWYDMVPLPVALPPLSNLATLASTSVLAMVTLRFRLLGRELPMNVTLQALGLSVLGIVGYITLFRWLDTRIAMVTLGATTLGLALLAAVREVMFSTALERERTQQLVTMGRFSQQLAHDLKNPLAALDGSLQFLKKERREGRSLAEHEDYLELMAEQVARLCRAVDDYQRIGRVEPVRMPVDVNDIVRSVLALQPFAAGAAVTVKRALADELPECHLDRDLVAGALENLLRNAFEAMPNGGAVTVHTESTPRGVSLSVEDEGVGMDARHRERAFDDFFTTKAAGTGLGLAFVRRVAEAHGGSVALTSRPGKGTVVRLEIPLRQR